MTAHTWVTEEIDGGALGSDDFYLCTTCGCSGGSVTAYNMRGVVFERDVEGQLRPTKREPQPFLPGPAIDLSQDCQVAHQQILFFVRGYLHSWDWNPGDDKKKELRGIMTQANRWTPETVARMEFYGLARECDESHLQYHQLSAETVRERLLGMGFKLEKASDADV
jgi:hypothetical protein